MSADTVIEVTDTLAATMSRYLGIRVPVGELRIVIRVRLNTLVDAEDSDSNFLEKAKSLT
jgi:hypothetical protein